MFDELIRGLTQATFNEYEKNGYKKDAEGFYICPKCGTRASRLTNDTLKMHVSAECECAKAKRLSAEKIEQKHKNEERRRKCFISDTSFSCTFENDNGTNPELTTAMQNYVNRFDDFKKDGKGLLLFGDVGHGKTYAACCVANALIDKGYSVKQTSFPRLEEETKAGGKFETIDRYIRQHDLIILDDLGVERSTEYINELVYSVIDTAYTKKTPLIITTNLTAEEIKKPSSRENKRVFDRLIGMCHPLEVNNPTGSQRKAAFAKSFYDTKEALGLL